MAGISIFKSTITTGQVMESYLIVNMETKEIYQRNGIKAEFGTYHQARMIRITLNDQTKERKGFGWGMGQGWTERKTDWQIVIASDVSINTVLKEVNLKMESGVYQRSKEPVHYASGDFKAIKRAPQTGRSQAKQDNRINELTIIVASFQADIKSIREQQVRIKNRADRCSDPRRKMICMQKLIELKQQEIEVKAKNEPAYKELLSKLARRRSSSQRTIDTNLVKTKTKVLIRRRKTS